MYRTLVLSALLTVLCADGANAQFLKNIVNTVKNTAQNRANSKADATTNKAIDKVDGTNSGKAGSGGPVDTSQAGMMKMLGLGTRGAGPTLSAADSAKAVGSFKTARGGSGYAFQYLSTMTTKKNGTTKDTSYRWLTEDGEGRSEMRIPMPGVASGKLRVIGKVSEPMYSIFIDADDKTYSLIVIDTALINSVQTSYSVQKVGQETVDGYSCIHVKLTSKTGSGMFKSSSTEDLWTSTSVPGYALYKNLCDQTINYGMMRALEQAGAGGMLVRMSASGKDYSMVFDLMSATKGSYPASLFEIPSGYTQDNKTILDYMLGGMKQTPSK